MGRLTDIQIQAWIRLGKPLAGKSDGDGLTFTLSKAGKAVWVLRYRLAGKGRERTIGSYPDTSLAAARKQATKLRAEIDTGVDVAAAKKEAKLASRLAKTFKELSEIYLEVAGPDLAATTLDETKRHLDKDIYPRIGNLAATKVLEAEVINLVGQIANRSQSVARRSFEILSVILSFGVSRHEVQRNPCATIKISSLIGQARPKRQRIMLTEDELRMVLPNANSLGQENALMLKILLATCVRKSELSKAKWEHIDTDAGIWHIPVENSKTKKSFDVPLAPTVSGWFMELKAVSGKSIYVLPARKKGYAKKATTISASTLNAALERVDFGVSHFSPHDLRSTARSYLVKQGMGLIAAERSLNHTLRGIVGVYDKYDYLDERRTGLEIWATFLKECEVCHPPNHDPSAALEQSAG